MVHFYFFPIKKPNYTDNSYFSESRDISYVLEKSDFFSEFPWNYQIFWTNTIILCVLYVIQMSKIYTSSLQVRADTWYWRTCIVCWVLNS